MVWRAATRPGGSRPPVPASRPDRDADRIKIVSQPAHALKARAYLRRQRPDLAQRLVRADDYRPGEWLVGKPLLAAYGLWKLRGLQPGARARGTARD